MTIETPPTRIGPPTDAQITLLLIEAQRGLMAGVMQIACAIEEVNCPHASTTDMPPRDEIALAAIAKAFEMNTDFRLYGRRSTEALLKRIAPEKGEEFAGPF